MLGECIAQVRGLTIEIAGVRTDSSSWSQSDLLCNNTTRVPAGIAGTIYRFTGFQKNPNNHDKTDETVLAVHPALPPPHRNKIPTIERYSGTRVILVKQPQKKRSV
jgi:hypothetical protein